MLTNRQAFCMIALRSCGTLSERTLRDGLGVHPLTLRSLNRRGLIRPGRLRSTTPTWEVN